MRHWLFEFVQAWLSICWRFLWMLLSRLQPYWNGNGKKGGCCWKIDGSKRKYALAPSNQHVCVNRGTPKNFTASVPKSRLNFLHEPFSPQKKHVGKNTLDETNMHKGFSDRIVGFHCWRDDPIAATSLDDSQKKTVKTWIILLAMKLIGTPMPKLIGISQCWC